MGCLCEDHLDALRREDGTMRFGAQMPFRTRREECAFWEGRLGLVPSRT